MSSLKQKTIAEVEKLQGFLMESPWKDAFCQQVGVMRQKLDEPCVLAVAGRVKAGKSSFINAFLGEELALVGTAETTATINYFRYGKPPDPERPVRVTWENERTTWESKAFLDALQGNTLEVLERASGIRQLEFFLDNPRLEAVHLVDTPGTGALVEKHIEVSEAFFNLSQRLRAQHAEQTVRITRDADAVIYLTGEVAQEGGADFLRDFQGDGTGSIHAFNTIGLMAKIDLSDELIEKRAYYSKHAEQMFNQVIPVPIRVYPISSGLRRMLDILTDADFAQWQESLKRGFAEKGGLAVALSNETMYKLPELPMCTLALDNRMAIRRQWPWRVFVVASRILYEKPLAEALAELRAIAGFDAVYQVLEEQFFQRGVLLRCHTVIQECCTLLRRLIRKELVEYESDLRRINSTTKKLIQEASAYIDYMDMSIAVLKKQGKDYSTLGNQFRCFLHQCMPKDRERELESRLKDLETRLNELLNAFEIVLHTDLAATNRAFEGLQRLENDAAHFNDAEKQELLRLFGGIEEKLLAQDADYCRGRSVFWRSESNGRPGKRREMAELAELHYDEVLRLARGG